TDPDDNPVDVAGLTLAGWSLTFAAPEPSTKTDAGGNYSFAVAPGTYTIGVAGVQAGPDPTRTATAVTGQTTGGVDFALTPAADLVATSFQVAGGFATWGQTVAVNYTLANHGLADA